jgi:lipoate-protein ligase A
VDQSYCSKNNITIGRRISGGGAVYHDSGNLNISIFISKSFLKFKVQNYQEIAEFFGKFVIKCLRNDLPKEDFRIHQYTSILCNDQKISGSAGYLRGNSVLHHLTLLLDSNLSHLEKSLLAGKKGYKSLRPSNYFPTSNLYSVTVDRIKEIFLSKIQSEFNLNPFTDTLTQEEMQLGTRLANIMYSKQQWIRDKKRILLERGI